MRALRDGKLRRLRFRRAPSTFGASDALRRHADFRKLWIGQTVSVFGDQFTLIVLPLVAAITLKVSPIEMGILTAAGWLPHLLFSLHIGLWIDRHGRRRRRMIATDLGRAAVLVTIPIAHAVDALTLPHLYAVAFAVGSLTVVFDMCWSTLFVSIVPRRDFIEANAKLFQSRSLAAVTGPILAGALVQVLKGSLAIALDALSFVASASILSRIEAKEPHPEPEPDTPLHSRLTAGARFLLRNQLYRASLLAFSTTNFFNLMFTSTFILYATRELGIRPTVLGIVLGGAAVGGVLGAAASSRLSRRLGVGKSMIVGCLVSSTPLLLVPAAAGPVWLVAMTLFTALFLSACGVIILDVNGNSLNAALAPDSFRARITGAHRVINYGVRPIGAVLGGLAGSWIGLRSTMWLATVGSTLAVLWLLPQPMRTLHTLPETAA